MKIILDTDIGGDFDDANALALLLSVPEVELVAVTTVGAGASAHKRAQVAMALLEAGGRAGVPVFAGADQPTVPNAVLDRLTPEHCLNAWTEALEDHAVQACGAVEAIVDLAERLGSELTVVCIGAMTNVAGAIRRAPDAMRGVREIVAMSGAFRGQLREANVTIDPEAADVVYRSGIPLRLIGFEEASKSRVELSDYGAHAASSVVVALLADMAKRYGIAYRTAEVVLYDVTAVAAVLHPEWFHFSPARVAVELDGAVSRGLTVVETDAFFNRVSAGTIVQIAVGSSPDRVTELFRSRVLKGPAA